MSTILVTGSSGYIGQALVAELTREGAYRIVGMDRRRPETDAGFEFVQGEFQCFEDLRRLDGLNVDELVHLAAVTGGCSERDGLLVNVEGTRCLMRYLIDRGCSKFVMASSSAVVGFQDPGFVPIKLPIPDEHPCLDKHGYGLSKYLMEELTRYLHRQNPAIDVINLRLGTVPRFDVTSHVYKIGPAGPWQFGVVSLLDLRDAVRLFATAVASPHKPGVRIMNAVASRVPCEDPVPVVLRTWLPDAELDLSHYERAGHEKDALLSIERVREELGFTPEHNPN